MDSVVGAAVAQNAADVDLRFQKGIHAIWMIVKDIAGVPVPSEDGGGLYTPPPIPEGFQLEFWTPTGISGIWFLFFGCN